MKEKIKIPKKELKQLYVVQKLSTSKISHRYNCNAETIRRRLLEYGIKTRYREIKIRIPIKTLKKLYKEKKISTLDLAKKYNCSSWTIRHNLIKNKIALRKPFDFLKWKSPGNQIVPNFKNISNLSYILGVILGDAWLYKYKNNYFIGLDALDKIFCISFFNSLKQLNLNPNIFPKGRHWRTIASSKVFYDWFKKLKFQDIKKMALAQPISFLKGFYESEGCLLKSYNKKRDKSYFLIIIVNTQKELIELAIVLLEKLGFNPKMNFRKTPLNRKDIWVVNLNRQKEVKAFLREINPCIKNNTKFINEDEEIIIQ